MTNIFETIFQDNKMKPSPVWDVLNQFVTDLENSCGKQLILRVNTGTSEDKARFVGVIEAVSLGFRKHFFTLEVPIGLSYFPITVIDKITEQQHTATDEESLRTYLQQLFQQHAELLRNIKGLSK